MSRGVDLHSHTTASDGVLSPRQLVREAARRGVRVLAITDHDSTDGLADAIDEATCHAPLTIVPGLEINCDVEGGEVHVLGYYVDYEAEWFREFLRGRRQERVARVHRFAARLAELGMPIDPAEVFAIVKEGSPGRPHVAQVMIKRGYVKSVREAFEKYLYSGGPASVPRRALTPVEAIAIIRRAHGLPVLAHPGRIASTAALTAALSEDWSGLEVYYPTHSSHDVSRFAGICDERDLIRTGGSDFHGFTRADFERLGEQPVKVEAYQRLLQASRDIRA